MLTVSEFISTNTKFQATRIESDDDDEVIPATPVDKGGRHRVKKMKKKTYQVNFFFFLHFLDRSIFRLTLVRKSSFSVKYLSFKNAGFLIPNSPLLD